MCILGYRVAVWTDLTPYLILFGDATKFFVGENVLHAVFESQLRVFREGRVRNRVQSFVRVQTAQILRHDGEIAHDILGILAVNHVEIVDDLHVGDGLPQRRGERVFRLSAANESPLLITHYGPEQNMPRRANTDASRRGSVTWPQCWDGMELVAEPMILCKILFSALVRLDKAQNGT